MGTKIGCSILDWSSKYQGKENSHCRACLPLLGAQLTESKIDWVQLLRAVVEKGERSKDLPLLPWGITFQVRVSCLVPAWAILQLHSSQICSQACTTLVLPVILNYWLAFWIDPGPASSWWICCVITGLRLITAFKPNPDPDLLIQLSDSVTVRLVPLPTSLLPLAHRLPPLMEQSSTTIPSQSLLLTSGARAHCAVIFSLLPTKIPRATFSRGTPQWVPSLHCCKGIFLPIFRIFNAYPLDTLASCDININYLHYNLKE